MAFRLVGTLSSGAPSEYMVQAAVTLGSLAYGVYRRWAVVSRYVLCIVAAKGYCLYNRSIMKHDLACAHAGPPEVVADLVTHNAEEALLNALSHPDIRVVEAAARSLKILYKAHTAQHRSVFQVRYHCSSLLQRQCIVEDK